MFDIVSNDLVLYLNSLRGANDDLDGVKLVQKSDANVTTQQHPAITIDWDGTVAFSNNRNHVDISGKFCITLYVVSLQGEAQAEAALQNLLCRWGTDTHSVARFMGLMPALWRMGGWVNSVTGQGFFIDIQPNVITGKIVTNKHQHYTCGAVVTAVVRTLLAPPQYGGNIP